MIKPFLIFVFLLLQCAIGTAQESLFIPKNATVFIGNTQAVGLFGNLLNSGNLSIESNGNFHFLGKIFYNASSATLTDKSLIKNNYSGGNINFQQPNPLYGNLGQQIIESKYNDSSSSGPSFSKISINNTLGVIISTDVNVLANVHFNKGHFYLNKYVAVLGDNANSATVTGFNESRYFVAGKNMNEGMLKLSALSSCCIASFPIGSSDTDYNPIQIRNFGVKDNFYLSVFKTPVSGGLSSLPKDSSINIIWKLYTTKNVSHQVEVAAQHVNNQEGFAFASLRKKSFITINKGIGWDKTSFLTIPLIPGNITSSSYQFTSMVNQRKIDITNQPIYISKKVTNMKEKPFIPNVFSPNGDGINDDWQIDFLWNYPECRVEIFNRNGHKIYSSVGYFSPFNGTYNGQPLPVATYYYIIDLRNGDGLLSGSVTILR